MSEKKIFIESTFTKEDPIFELPLRPSSLDEFSGQDEIKERLSIFIGAAKKRNEALGHLLLSGPPGLGKTTLAGIVAKTMNHSLVITSGPMLEKPADLTGILTNLKSGDHLFIDEIHRMNRSVEEYLYPALEDFALDLMIDSGPNARSVRVKLNPFTLIGATTRMGLLTLALRTRFAFNCRLNYYPPSCLQKILFRSSRILKLDIDEAALFEIASRSRGTPRIANHLLRWVRDYAQMHSREFVDKAVVNSALKLLAVDDLGLEEMDMKILDLIIEHHEGGPVGINTLAVALGESPQTLEEVYEPFLIMQGLLRRTPRGREATHLAYQHLGKIKNTVEKSIKKKEAKK